MRHQITKGYINKVQAQKARGCRMFDGDEMSGSRNNTALFRVNPAEEVFIIPAFKRLGGVLGINHLFVERTLKKFGTGR